MSSSPFFTCLCGVRVVQCCHLTCLRIFSSVLWRTLRFPPKIDVRFVFTPIYNVRVHVLFMFFLAFTYSYWCPTWIPHQMIFLSFNSNTTGASSRAGTVNHPGSAEPTPGFSGGRSFVICVVFCWYLLVLFLLAIGLSVLFLLAIGLSVLFRFTDSDYLYGIFKLFLNSKGISLFYRL